MGGCATKPKVLKGDDEFAPVPTPAPATAPAPAPEAIKDGYEAKEVVNGEETKETTHEEGPTIGVNEKKVEAEGGDGDQGDAVKVNDKGNAPHARSLSNFLFEESQQEKESLKNGETTETPVLSSEPLKHEENLKTENTPAAEVESTPAELDSTPAELDSTPAVIVASEEKPVITTVADGVKGETENEKKEREEEEKVVDAEDVTVTEKAVKDDQIQEKPVLPAAPAASAAPEVVEEVTESK